MTNSRSKGKGGELEWARLLRSHGFDARRSQQFNGAAKDGEMDVVSSGPVPNWEVKRVQSLSLPGVVERATEEGGHTPSAVVWRRNHGKWLVAMDADRFLELLTKIPADPDGLQKKEQA